MELAELLALRVPAEALGLDEARYDAVRTYAISEAQQAAITVTDATLNAQAVQAHALATLLRLELEHLRRAYSGGSGPDGSFSMAELSARMAELKAEIARQEGILSGIIPPVTVTPTGATRASGSQKIVYEA